MDPDDVGELQGAISRVAAHAESVSPLTHSWLVLSPG